MAIWMLRAVLLIYPRSFRARFGPEMLEQARALHRSEEMSRVTRALRGLWLVWDSLAHVVEAHRLDADRTSGMWSTLLHEGRQSARRVSRARMQFVSVVGILGASIGAVTVSLALASSVLMPDLGYPNHEQIVTLLPEASWSRADVEGLDEALEGIELSYYNSWGYSLIGVGEASRLRGGLVSPNYFDVLGVRPSIGRGFIESDGFPGAEPVVIVSHELWRVRFGGDTAVVGRQFDFRSTQHSRARLVGVLPAAHQPLDPEWQLWAPDRSAVGSEWADRRFRASLGRVAPGVDGIGANARLREAVASLPGMESTPETQMASLGQWLYQDVERNAFLFLIASLAILGMAVTNVAVLEGARQVTQLGDAATRMALGASGRRVALGLVMDNMIRSSIGGGLGVAIGMMLARVSGSWLPFHNDLRRGLEIDGIVAAGAMSLCLLVGVLLAANAVRVTRRAGLRSSISGQTQGVRTRGRGLGVLVGVQVGVTLSMTVLSSVLLISIWRLNNVDAGFNPEQVLSAHVYASGDQYQEPEQTTALFDAIEERLMSVPGVRAVGSTHTLPLTSERWTSRVWVGGIPDTVSVNYRMVSAGFFRSIGLSLESGRFPRPDDRAGSDAVVVVNHSLAARLGLPEGGGVSLSTDIGNVRAIGVVEDILQHELNSERGPEMYVLVDPLPYAIGSRYVTIAATPRSGITPLLTRNIISELDPNVVVSRVNWMDEVGARGVADVAILSRLVVGLGALALLLGALGVWGVTAQSARARCHEFGVRAALGASGGRLVRDAMGHMTWVASGGALVGFAGSLLMGPLIATHLYEVEVGQVGPTVLALGVTMGVALLSAWLPARAAAKSDPVDSLRPR